MQSKLSSHWLDTIPFRGVINPNFIVDPAALLALPLFDQAIANVTV